MTFPPGRSGSPGRGSAQGRSYRYYDLVLAAFVTAVLCSNPIGPAKTA